MAQTGMKNATFSDMRYRGPYLAALHRYVTPMNRSNCTAGDDAQCGRRAIGRHTRIGLVIFLLMGGLLAAKPYAQNEKPFSLPFSETSGPSTWLLSQLYGNTIFAYYQRNNIYDAGQGLHFGIDFNAPCLSLIHI